MQRKNIVIGEEYLVKLPLSANTRWRGVKPSKVLSVDEPMLNGKRNPTVGIKVEHDSDEYIVHSRDVLKTWAQYEDEKKQQESKYSAYQQHEAARQEEIVDAHLTLCALLQRAGKPIPDVLLNAQGDYTLDLNDLLVIAGANEAELAANYVRPTRPEKVPVIPEPVKESDVMRRMFVLGKVADCVEHLRELNEDPVELSSELGSRKTVLGYVAETPSTDLVISACSPMPASRVRKELSALRQDHYLWSTPTGWCLTATGKQTLKEFAV